MKRKTFKTDNNVSLYLLIQFTSVLFYNDLMCNGIPTKLTHGYLIFCRVESFPLISRFHLFLANYLEIKCVNFFKTAKK
jgi:hypothetical protein